jgi:hypothetical protein
MLKKTTQYHMGLFEVNYCVDNKDCTMLPVSELQEADSVIAASQFLASSYIIYCIMSVVSVFVCIVRHFNLGESLLQRCRLSLRIVALIHAALWGLFNLAVMIGLIVYPSMLSSEQLKFSLGADYFMAWTLWVVHVLVGVFIALDAILRPSSLSSSPGAVEAVTTADQNMWNPMPFS